MTDSAAENNRRNGKGENVRDWLYVVDHARAIDTIFHNGKIAETYNIGGFNEWKNIDIIKVLINTVDRLLGRSEGADMDLITYVTDRAGHDLRYAIDSTKLQKELAMTRTCPLSCPCHASSPCSNLPRR